MNDVVDSSTDWIEADERLSTGKTHKWNIIFKNGTKLDFEGGWNQVGSNPAPSQFFRDVQDFHARGCPPPRHQNGQTIGYRFENSSAGALLAIDVTQVEAVLVELKT